MTKTDNIRTSDCDKSIDMLFFLKRSFSTVLISLLFFLSPVVSYAHNNETDFEYASKAVNLYNFTKFINWPADILSRDNRNTLNICILAPDPFGHTLDYLSSKTSQGHKVKVEYIDEINNELLCHIMFIGKSKQDSIEHLINSLSGKKILYVSDIEGFSEKGGCITLELVNDQVQFNVNLKAAHNANLRVSAKLLELANRVFE